MALQVLAGPGCDDLKVDALEELALEEGDVTISVGRMVESLTGTVAVPSENPQVLRAALALRTAAINLAREKDLNGVVLTSNGSRQDLEKLRQLAGAEEIRIVALTELQACARIRKLVAPGDRREACEQGVRGRWFGRYVAAPGDRPVRPKDGEQREALMENKVRRSVELEVREEEGGPRLHGVLIQEGRAATGGRAELFAPGSLLWPPDGIEIRTVHRGPTEARAVPTRYPNGEIRISAPASPAIVAAVNGGKRGMSVEFTALREERTAGGVREIQRAYVDGGALTAIPEYNQGAVEVRAKRATAVWL